MSKSETQSKCAKITGWKQTNEDLISMMWSGGCVHGSKKHQKQIRWSVLSCLSVRRCRRYPAANATAGNSFSQHVRRLSRTEGLGLVWLWTGLQAHGRTTTPPQTPRSSLYLSTQAANTRGTLSSPASWRWAPEKQTGSKPKQRLEKTPPPPSLSAMSTVYSEVFFIWTSKRKWIEIKHSQHWDLFNN